MTANPDALRRAADEMEAQSTRIGRLVADLRDRADKIHEVRLELGRAGFPVDEGAWPTDALRQLVDAHIALKAKPWSDAPITMALCSLLGDCRPAEIVDRVRSMTFELAAAKGKQFAYHDHLAKLREALDAANAGPADGTLVERVRGLARRLEATELDRAGLVATTDTLRREWDGARDGKPPSPTTAPEPAWSSCCIHNAGRRIWLTKQGPNWHVSRDGLSPVLAADFSSALALEGLLAGHDPGGVWRVAGDPVTVAVVRAVCPTVAVSWAQT